MSSMCRACVFEGSDRLGSPAPTHQHADFPRAGDASLSECAKGSPQGCPLWRPVSPTNPTSARLPRTSMLVERESLPARLAVQASPFFHYNAIFDPQEVMRRHAVPRLRAREGYVTNFLGVVVDPKFLPAILDGRGGHVEAIPIPANWHADIAEWGAALGQWIFLATPSPSSSSDAGGDAG